MLTLNVSAPAFSLEGVCSGAQRRYQLADAQGRWLVLFFYPADFTFLCPTEILGFQQRRAEFEANSAMVFAISVDGVESHKEWARELGGIDFPLLSDPGAQVCRAYGVLNEQDQRAHRATVIVSRQGEIAYLVVSPMNVGRSVGETLRVVQALQSGRLCPADWRPGQPTGEPSLRR